jgi:hypothetical protein
MPVEVEALELAMQSLLALLADPNSTGIDEAWERCGSAQVEVSRVLEKASQLSVEERAELRKGLERLVRLNAITRQAARHAQDSLAGQLSANRQSSEQMDGYRVRSEAPGGSCNMAG